MSNNLKRAIKYNRVKGYWYLEGSNHSEYRQLQNGERLTTTRGTVQYFSNGTKKYLAKPKPNINVVVNNLWKFENAQNNGFNPKTKTYRPYRTPNGNLDVANGIDLKKNPKYKKEAQLGISKDRANQIASEVLMPEQKYIDNNLKKYTNYPDTISPQIKEGLLDMYWQLGNGLYKYQNLFNAIANGDISQIREESKVQYKTPTGKWNFDKGRYENRLNEYFHYKFGGIITKRRFI